MYRLLPPSILLLLVFCLALSPQVAAQNQAQPKTLLIFFDGLRPDYITPELMPNLHGLKTTGSYGTQHHSVFPTVTRVNSASYATGSYPARHGLMGNSVFFPQVEPAKSLNTGEATDLDRIAEATGGNLLTAVSLGELLQAAGTDMMVFSSGSTGQALLQNHKVTGGGIINPGLILPATRHDEVVQKLGMPPAYAKPNTARHQWVTEALFAYGLVPQGPPVCAIWYSDPDGAAHADGIGSAAAVAAIRSVDQELGRILAYMKENNLTDAYNILFSTDHGFVTYVGKDNLTDFLVKEGFKQSKESEDVVLAGGAIYVKNRDPKLIKQMVAALQGQEWVGALFTKAVKPGSTKGVVEGTLSFETIHWNHGERTADLLVVENWDDRKNEQGYAGTSFARGVAGHGGSSPYEIHIPLLAYGPSFKKSYQGTLPTSNVDLVPTILHLHGIPVPAAMDGRVLSELLTKPASPAPKAAKTETLETSAKLPWGTYTLTLERSLLGQKSYVNHTKVTRVVSTAKRK